MPDPMPDPMDHGVFACWQLRKKPSTRPIWGAQINDRQFQSLICEESGNDIFRFPWSKKPRMDFLRPFKRAPKSMTGNFSH